MSAVTVGKDLRGVFGPSRDQGPRPTCLAFAVSDAHAAARSPWADLSCEYLFFKAKGREQAPPTKGARLSYIRPALEQDGQPIEAEWRYLAKIPPDLSQWGPPATVTNLFRRATTMLAGGFDEAWTKVEAGTPVLIVTTISDAFYTPNADGVVNSAEPPDPARRHAIVAAATGEHAGVRCLLGRNSWGETWGLQGHAWLAEPYLKPRISTMLIMN